MQVQRICIYIKERKGEIHIRPGHLTPIFSPQYEKTD